MSVDSFLDSNVLLYTFDKADPRKQRIARFLVETALKDGTACISYQVVQEVLNVLTRKHDPPISTGDAMQCLAVTLDPLWRVQPSADLVRSGISVRERYGFSFYDSLIVAAALSAGCSRLLTEDMQHGQRIEGLTIENPFLT
jgi:predicted nucleic acid-binding protein